MTPPPLLLGGRPRHRDWRKVRAAFLKVNPACAACGSKPKRKDVHHVLPYHLFPERELDAANLVTMCRWCHFVIGHLNDWCSWNANFEVDVRTHREKVRVRP